MNLPVLLFYNIPLVTGNQPPAHAA